MLDYTIQKQKRSKVWHCALKILGYQNFFNGEVYSHLKAMKHWDNKDAKANKSLEAKTNI